jgi:hypothetical protein
LEFGLKTKKPTSVIAGGLGISEISLAVLLDQAMAVRRHGVSMMVVMAVMVAGLHLSSKLRGKGGWCQPGDVGKVDKQSRILDSARDDRSLGRKRKQKQVPATAGKLSAPLKSALLRMTHF